MNLYYIILLLIPCQGIIIFNKNFEDRKVIKYIGQRIIKYSIKLSLFELYRKRRDKPIKKS